MTQDPPLERELLSGKVPPEWQGTLVVHLCDPGTWHRFTQLHQRRQLPTRELPGRKRTAAGDRFYIFVLYTRVVVDAVVAAKVAARGLWPRQPPKARAFQQQ